MDLWAGRRENETGEEDVRDANLTCNNISFLEKNLGKFAKCGQVPIRSDGYMGLYYITLCTSYILFFKK